MSSGAPWSLRNRQLLVLTVSLTIVAIVLGVGGAFYISNFTERSSDRVLGASANSIAETIALTDGNLTVEIPQVAFGMLEGGSQDNVYYSVYHGSDFITGYEDLPPPTNRRGSTNPSERINFRYDRYLDQDIRVASVAVRLPRSSQPAIIQVGETLNTRTDQTNAMLVRLLGLEAFLVIVAAALIGPAIKWGMLPLTRLQSKIANIEPAAGRAEPVDLSDVPAELHGLVSTFNSLLSRLDASAQKMRDFTADASHQMRTPLATLRTHLMLLRRDRLQTATGETALVEVEAAADRLQRILSQLLALARSDDLGVRPAAAGGRTPDLAEEVRQIVSEMVPTAVSKGITIEVHAGEKIAIRSHSIVLAEILTNLVDNAIRYNRPGGHIAINCEKTAHSATITVEDDGPGIPEEMREAVFQRFFRLQRDSSVPGSGLGLPIVQTMARTVGADVHLGTPASGKGLAVTVSFPLVTSR